MSEANAVVTTEMKTPITSDLDETGNHAMQTHAANESVSPMAAMLSMRNHDPEAIGKLWDIQKDWEGREARKAFFAAKSAAAIEIPAIVKDRNNNFLGNDYASLDAMIAGVGPVAGKHGLSVKFDFDQEKKPGSVVAVCTCTHDDGHSETTTAVMPIMAPIKSANGKNATNDCQMVGNAMTYGRRYSFASMFSIATVDYDANAQQSAPPPPPEPIDDKSLSTLVDLLDVCDQESEGYSATWKAHYKKKFGEADNVIGIDMTQKQFLPAKKDLVKRLEKLKADQLADGQDDTPSVDQDAPL